MSGIDTTRLPARLDQLLLAVDQFIHIFAEGPTVEELAGEVCSPWSTVHADLTALVDAGLIRRELHQERSITITAAGRARIGELAADLDRKADE